MDIDRLSSDLEFAAHLGQGIPLEDLMKLKLVLKGHREEFPQDRVQLWGRVRGFHNDYYVMVATREQRGRPFPLRTFFWANESFKFSPLPSVSPAHADLLSQQNGYFTGEHDRVVVRLDAAGAFEHLDPEDDERTVE